MNFVLGFLAGMLFMAFILTWPSPKRSTER